MAAKAFARYRAAGGVRTGVLPDFFIGAQAAALNLPLLTRDPARVRSHFPGVVLIAPESTERLENVRFAPGKPLADRPKAVARGRGARDPEPPSIVGRDTRRSFFCSIRNGGLPRGGGALICQTPDGFRRFAERPRWRRSRG